MMYLLENYDVVIVLRKRTNCKSNDSDACKHFKKILNNHIVHK